MYNFTAVIEKDGDWYIAYCPEVSGANGQGKTIEECKKNLAEAIVLITETIPRHSEIPDKLARKICKCLEIPDIKSK